MAALAVAGLPTDRFLFAGFPPSRAAARRAFLEDIAGIRATLIFFEGGSRMAASLADMARVLGPRQAAVARELTKLHESVVRGSLAELATDERLASPKGEIVIVVGPGEEAVATVDEAEMALAEALTRLSPSAAASEVARALHLPRRELYARALALRAQ
jgi:16S rRNA (cytidine1402-2'-O)-methyltransferase